MSAGASSPAPAAPPTPGLLSHRLVYVCGKGGTGKSTVAAALGLAAVARGRRTIVAEVHRRDDIAHVVRAGGADHLTIDPQAALEEYLIDQLPVRALADRLAASRAFGYLAAATPGLREMVTAGKLWELAQDERRIPGQEPYDLVVVDAPATGHALAVLAAPRTFAAAARVGPIARQSRIIGELFGDPARTAVVAVTTAEELPVAETLELREALRTEAGLELSLVVVNGLREPLFTKAEARRLRGSADHPAVRAALSEDARARAGRERLTRLSDALAGATPLVELPFDPGGPDLAALAGRLEALL